MVRRCSLVSRIEGRVVAKSNGIESYDVVQERSCTPEDREHIGCGENYCFMDCMTSFHRGVKNKCRMFDLDFKRVK
jgi:hypothetical protein